MSNDPHDHNFDTCDPTTHYIAWFVCLFSILHSWWFTFNKTTCSTNHNTIILLNISSVQFSLRGSLPATHHARGLSLLSSWRNVQSRDCLKADRNTTSDAINLLYNLHSYMLLSLSLFTRSLLYETGFLWICHLLFLLGSLNLSRYNQTANE